MNLILDYWFLPFIIIIGYLMMKLVIRWVGTTTVYEGPAIRAGKYVFFFDLVVADALRKSQL